MNGMPLRRSLFFGFWMVSLSLVALPFSSGCNKEDDEEFLPDPYHGGDDDDDIVDSPDIPDDSIECIGDPNRGLVSELIDQLALSGTDPAALELMLSRIYGKDLADLPSDAVAMVGSVAVAQGRPGVRYPLGALLEFLAQRDPIYDSGDLLLLLQEHDRQAQQDLCNPVGVPILMVAGLPSEAPNPSYLENETILEPFDMMLLGFWRGDIRPEAPAGTSPLGGALSVTGCSVSGNKISECGKAAQEILIRRAALKGMDEAIEIGSAIAAISPASSTTATTMLGECLLGAFADFMAANLDDGADFDSAKAIADARWAECMGPGAEALLSETGVSEAFHASYDALTELREAQNGLLGQCISAHDECASLSGLSSGCREGSFRFSAVVGPMCEGFGQISATCQSDPLPNGTPCSDGDLCTSEIGESCREGVCQPGLSPCDEILETCQPNPDGEYDCVEIVGTDDDDLVDDDDDVEPPYFPGTPYLGVWKWGDVTISEVVFSPSGDKSTRFLDLPNFRITFELRGSSTDQVHAFMILRDNVSTGCFTFEGFDCILMDEINFEGNNLYFTSTINDGTVHGEGWMELWDHSNLNGQFVMEYEEGASHVISTLRWDDMIRVNP